MQINGETAAFFENRNGAKLFGIVHRAASPDSSNLGVVFCHPMGWEKTFSYRAYAEFSRFLAQHGFSSCRFDAFGFGDSDGEPEDATIRTQVDDALAAIDWLAETAGCTRFVLIGARLGAAVAAFAAESSSSVAGLVLVSPVVNGNDFWKETIRFSRFGRMTLGQKPVGSKAIQARLENEGAAELDGEMLGRDLVEELRSIDLTTRETKFRGKCFLRELQTGGSDRAGFEAYAATMTRGGADVTASFDEPKEFWIIRNRYEGYVPKRLFSDTLEWLKEVRSP